jgi:hypothetical protein
MRLRATSFVSGLLTAGYIGALAWLDRRNGYFSGFAFTAFVYERVLDVVVVLGLAVLGTWQLSVFPVVAGFAVLVLAIVIWVCRHPQQLSPLQRLLSRLGWPRLARAVAWVELGVAHTAIWMKPIDLTVAVSLGILGWGLTAVAFKLLLDSLGVNLPLVQSLSLYPVALLAGFDVPLVTATVAAIGIRLSTLWLATALGLCALMVLARMQRPGGKMQTIPGEQPAD